MQQQACQAALLTYQELDAGREGRGGEGGRTEARRLARYPYGPQHAEADELVLNVPFADSGREVSYARASATCRTAPRMPSLFRMSPHLFGCRTTRASGACMSTHPRRPSPCRCFAQVCALRAARPSGCQMPHCKPLQSQQYRTPVPAVSSRRESYAAHRLHVASQYFAVALCGISLCCAAPRLPACATRGTVAIIRASCAALRGQATRTITTAVAAVRYAVAQHGAPMSDSA